MKYAITIAALLLFAGCHSGPTYLEVSKMVEIEQEKLDELQSQSKKLLQLSNEAYINLGQEKGDEVIAVRQVLLERIQEQSGVVGELKDLRNSLTP